MGRTKRRNRLGEGRAWLRWHRRTGFTLSIVFIVVSATGILLNHSRTLGLDDRRIDTPWLYRWYGMQPDVPIVSFSANDRRISKVGAMLYLDASPVAATGKLIGAASLPSIIVAATPEELILLSSEGQIVERLSSAALPSESIKRLGTTPDRRLAIETIEGRYEFDNDLIEWRLADGADPDWSTPSPIGSSLESEILENYRGEGLSYYRVLLDIHSGAFFGSFGEIVADLSALGLILLTLTGIYYTYKYKRRARNANEEAD